MIRKAFTLIELLVVIAIIAILAAILFPVFAQAKEAAKKSASLSNVKQTALGIILYSADYDDNYPSAYSMSSLSAGSSDPWSGAKVGGQALTFTGVVPPGYFWVTTVPAGADAAAGIPDDSQEWANSCQPYMKNYGVTTNPGAPQLDVYGNTVSYVKKVEVTSYCMNGLLSVYSATGVVQPSRTPLVWPGEQKNNYSGGNWSNPMMKCDNTTINPAPPCRFAGAGAPQSNSTIAAGSTADGNIRNSVANNYSWWLYSQGFNYASTDSSAHFTRVANGGSYTQPFYTVLSDGQTGSPIRCTSAATVGGGLHYAAWFRPDSTFNYGLTNTAATQEVCNN